MIRSIYSLAIPVFILALLSWFPLAAQETQGSNDSEYVVDIGDEGSMNWAQKVLLVKGNGFGPERVKELGRRKILAKRAAKMDAYRNLVEVIKGVYVTSNTKVQDMMLESDSIKAKTDGMLKGMRVVDVTYSNDGGCEITVEVNIDKRGGFLLSALSTNEVKVKDDYPKFDWVAMRNDLETRTAELAETKTKLSKTNRNLRSTRYALSNSRKELKKIKEEYAQLDENFTSAKNNLIATNLRLARTEEQLKFTDGRKDELKALYKSTKKELGKTEAIVTNLRATLNNTKTKLAVNQKELAMSKTYLGEKKKELGVLAANLVEFGKNYQNTQLDRAKLQGYIRRIKDVQEQTGQRLNTFYMYDAPTGDKASTRNQAPTAAPANNARVFTGLLIDARGLNLKPVLAPSILNQKKQKMYGIGVIPTSHNSGAIVAYLSGEVDKAKIYPKIGSEPLVIKAQNVVNQSDITISDADAQKLPSILELLKKQKVAILM